MKTALAISTLSFFSNLAMADDIKDATKPVKLFNGKDLTGWKILTVEKDKEKGQAYS